MRRAAATVNLKNAADMVILRHTVVELLILCRMDMFCALFCIIQVHFATYQTQQDADCPR